MKSTLTYVILLVLATAAAASAASSVVRSGKSVETHPAPSPPPPPPPPPPPSRFAALDEVRLLANGLLQLGQSLREFVHKTRGQINDIFQKINIFDRSFYQLTVLASEIREEEEELKKTTVTLKANNEAVKTLSLEINSKVEGILEDRDRLRSKVVALEKQLSSLSRGLVTTQQLAQVNALRVSDPRGLRRRRRRRG